jgi:hypothetical protein
MRPCWVLAGFNDGAATGGVSHTIWFHLAHAHWRALRGRHVFARGRAHATRRNARHPGWLPAVALRLKSRPSLRAPGAAEALRRLSGGFERGVSILAVIATVVSISDKLASPGSGQYRRGGSLVVRDAEVTAPEARPGAQGRSAPPLPHTKATRTVFECRPGLASGLLACTLLGSTDALRNVRSHQNGQTKVRSYHDVLRG